MQAQVTELSKRIDCLRELFDEDVINDEELVAQVEQMEEESSELSEQIEMMDIKDKEQLLGVLVTVDKKIKQLKEDAEFFDADAERNAMFPNDEEEYF